MESSGSEVAAARNVLPKMTPLNPMCAAISFPLSSRAIPPARVARAATAKIPAARRVLTPRFFASRFFPASFESGAGCDPGA